MHAAVAHTNDRGKGAKVRPRRNRGSGAKRKRAARVSQHASWLSAKARVRARLEVQERQAMDWLESPRSTTTECRLARKVLANVQAAYKAADRGDYATVAAELIDIEIDSSILISNIVINAVERDRLMASRTKARARGAAGGKKSGETRGANADDLNLKVWTEYKQAKSDDPAALEKQLHRTVAAKLHGPNFTEAQVDAVEYRVQQSKKVARESKSSRSKRASSRKSRSNHASPGTFT